MTRSRRSRLDDDIDDEFRSHVLHRADDLERDTRPARPGGEPVDMLHEE